MPKRMPTPEPGDDEPKYFTVVHPYPLNAHWELEDDYTTCGRWIASCIGSAPFFAIFYKPSARGQILLEISRDYPEPERLLGEHRWSDFLKKPSAEEAGRVSQIFYCTYSTGRQAQKDGWKRINVDESWFENRNPVNPDSAIMHPYPPTAWCPLPPEDKTSKPMCRPLPVRVKAPPAPKVAPPPPVVPGSANWVSQKAAPPTNTPAANSAKNAGGTKTGNRGRGNAKNKAGKKAIPANSAAPWHTATAPTGSNTVPVVARNAAENMIQNMLAGPPDLAAGFADMSLTSGIGVDDISPDADAYVAEWEATPAEEDVDAFWPSAYRPGDRGGGGLDDYAYAHAKDDWGEGAAEAENPWGDAPDDNVNANATVNTNAKPAPNDIVCPVHGILCRKGICSERARLVRERERAERAKNVAEYGRRKNHAQKKADMDGGKTAGDNSNGGGGWQKKKGDDDPGSSEERSRAPSPATPKTDGWATARR
ncbi:hypothetical protein K438DRAFT_1861679 [Mycena galopus ATCC 62051]|nr:hypothetical protein K438DRAFT_1861679 [Mycena galopus ATCC 62051]